MAKDNFITAYLLRVDEETRRPYKGYLSKVENSLEAEQRYVNFGRSGALIQVISMDGIDYILNDDGKLLGFPYNRALMVEGKVVDIFAGNIMCVRHNAEGEFIDIKESDIEIIEKRLQPILTVVAKTVFLSLADSLPVYKEDDSHGNTD